MDSFLMPGLFGLFGQSRLRFYAFYTLQQSRQSRRERKKNKEWREMHSSLMYVYHTGHGGVIKPCTLISSYLHAIKYLLQFRLRRRLQNSLTTLKRDDWSSRLKTRSTEQCCKFINTFHVNSIQCCTCMSYVLRHEIAEAAGLISQAFGTEEVDRHIVLFKKVHVSLHSLVSVTIPIFLLYLLLIGVCTNRSWIASSQKRGGQYLKLPYYPHLQANFQLSVKLGERAWEWG